MARIFKILIFIILAPIICLIAFLATPIFHSDSRYIGQSSSAKTIEGFTFYIELFSTSKFDYKLLYGTQKNTDPFRVDITLTTPKELIGGNVTLLSLDIKLINGLNEYQVLNEESFQLPTNLKITEFGKNKGQVRFAVPLGENLKYVKNSRLTITANISWPGYDNEEFSRNFVSYEDRGIAPLLAYQ